MWREQVERNDLDQMLSNGGREDAAAIDQLVDDGIAWAKTVLKASIKQAREDGIIDFDDMLYMPLLDNVRFFQIDWALVDEAQDTNPVRRELIRRMLKPTGRLIAVGDPRQAIYGFTGADAESMDIIAQTFKCVTLPLTVTFRCPKAVVRVAQQWVSHIQAAETAPEGIYREISQDDFNALPAGEFRVDDAILCRNTAPLVKLAMSLIRKKVACHVEGRDIAAGLVKLARRWKVKTLAALSDRLDTYLKNEMEKALAKKQEMKAQQIEDTVETLRVFISDLKPGDSIDTLVAVIESLFGDTEADKRPDSLTLSTIHKSKGREWARVFWYGRAKWQPSKYARQEWQQVQEDNLCYVAATRSMHELVEVHVS
jgi:superfamily I DNA/RNA helicase